MNMDETWVNHGVKETYPNICGNRRFDFPALWDRVCEKWRRILVGNMMI